MNIFLVKQTSSTGDEILSFHLYRSNAETAMLKSAFDFAIGANETNREMETEPRYMSPFEGTGKVVSGIDIKNSTSTLLTYRVICEWIND